MKKLMGLMIYGGIIFGLSAGGAWYMHSMHQAELAMERSKNEPDPDAALVKSTTAEPTIVDPAIPDRTDKTVLSQVPVRPEAMSVEEIVRHGMKLKERDAAIRAREQSLERVEAQYNLMLEDIKSEQREIEGLMLQAREHRKAANELLEQADAKRQEANSLYQQANSRKKETKTLLEKAESQSSRNMMSQVENQLAPETTPEVKAEDREANLRQLSDVLSGMDPAAAGGMLMGYIKNDDLDTAVKLVAKMEGRKSAAILEAMSEDDEDGNVDRLLQEFATMKRPPKTAKR